MLQITPFVLHFLQEFMLKKELDGKYYYFDCTNNASFGDENAFAWKNKGEMLFSPKSEYDPYLPSNNLNCCILYTYGKKDKNEKN